MPDDSKPVHAFDEAQALCAQARARKLQPGDQITPKLGPLAGTVYEVAHVIDGQVIVSGSCGADSTPADSFDRLPLTPETIANALQAAWDYRPVLSHGDVIVGYLGRAIADAVADLRIVRVDHLRPEGERGQTAVLTALLRASGALVASLSTALDTARSHNARLEARIAQLEALTEQADQ